MHLGRDNCFFTGHEHEHVRERALGARHGQPQEDAGADQHARERKTDREEDGEKGRNIRCQVHELACVMPHLCACVPHALCAYARACVDLLALM